MVAAALQSLALVIVFFLAPLPSVDAITASAKTLSLLEVPATKEYEDDEKPSKKSVGLTSISIFEFISPAFFQERC